MDPQTAAALAALMPLFESLVALGIPGILLGMAAIPALVITLICWLNHRHDRQITKLLEAYRNDTQEIMRLFTEKHQELSMDFSSKHGEVVNMYKNNVTLVQNYEKLNDGWQALIVNNTRTVERLCVLIEAIGKK